jgi:prepilin-type processing-associated H-X9-DG protein
LPAVQAAREAARRTECSNHLKQVGLAYHHHENAYKAFPPLMVSDPAKSVGWGLFLLPFMEQQPLYEQYNRDAPFHFVNAAYGIDNQSVSNTQLEVMRCPSAPEREPYTYTFNFPGYPSFSWQAAAADYSPLRGVSTALNNYLALSYQDTQLQGVLNADQQTPLSQITDGTSNTMLIAEIAGKNDLWLKSGPAGVPLTGFFGGQGGWADATSGGSKLFGSTNDGTISPGPCGVNCSNDYGLFSFHSGGANSVFADGSVRFLNENLEMESLVGFITRQGGEIPPGAL